MDNRVQGFTLVEMLVVVGLMATMAVFSLQTYIDDHEEILAENVAMDLMTIANAAVLHASGSANQWHDEVNDCDGLQGDLESDNYIVSLTTILDESSCPPGSGDHKILTLKYRYAGWQDDVIPNMIASKLPSAKVNNPGGSYEIEMTVLKPQPSRSGEMGVGSIIVDTITKSAQIIKQLTCGAGKTEKIFVTVNAACVDETAAAPEGALRGFYIEKTPVSNGWSLELMARGMASGAIYIARDACGGSPIRFDYIRYCK